MARYTQRILDEELSGMSWRNAKCVEEPCSECKKLGKELYVVPDSMTPKEKYCADCLLHRGCYTLKKVGDWVWRVEYAKRKWV